MRENGFRAIGGLAQRLTSGIAKGRGASIARLRAEWGAIAGPELARITRPEALLSGRGARAGGSGTGKVLRLRVPGASALEVQHMSGQIVERVNAYFGHKMIDDIRLVQGAIATRPAPPAIPTPDAQTVKRVADRAASVKDPELRAALTKLGARVAVNRRHVLLLGALGAGAAFLARDLEAQDLSLDKLLGPLPGDHILGKPDAPNVIIDYFSFTCPHCANFSAAVLPAVRREWIDDGRVKFIYRHFPSDSVATHAAQLAEGAGPEKFFAAVEALFRAQVDWLTVDDPEAEMVKALGGVGLSVEAARACLADDRLLDKVVADVQSGQALRVTSTPTLFINEQNYGNPGGGSAPAIAAILRQVGR